MSAGPWKSGTSGSLVLPSAWMATSSGAGYDREHRRLNLPVNQIRRSGMPEVGGRIAAEVVRLGTTYLTVIAFMLPALFITEVISSIFRAVGDTKTPMRLVLVAIGVNTVLDPLLIFGIGPFPQLGIGGAALATVIGYYMSLGLSR